MFPVSEREDSIGIESCSAARKTRVSSVYVHTHRETQPRFSGLLRLGVRNPASRGNKEGPLGIQLR